jgi:hypothetical protein
MTEEHGHAHQSNTNKSPHAEPEHGWGAALDGHHENPEKGSLSPQKPTGGPEMQDDHLTF